MFNHSDIQGLRQASCLVPIITLFLASAALAGDEPEPFDCTDSAFADGSAFVVDGEDPKFFRVKKNTDGTFTFVQIGDEAFTGGEINNIGFLRTGSSQGLLLGVQITVAEDDDGRGDSVKRRIVQIDKNGDVFPLKDSNDDDVTLESLDIDPENGTDLPLYDAGDVSFDGNKMYINRAGTGDFFTVTLGADPSAAEFDIQREDIFGRPAGSPGGRVNDWAFNPADGKLYGGEANTGSLAELDLTADSQSRILRKTTNIVGLPGSSASPDAFGAAWFDGTGTLFLYRNRGKIFTIDIGGPRPKLIGSGADATQAPENKNDGAWCPGESIGAALRMFHEGDPDPSPNPPSAADPITITIHYTFENFNKLTSLNGLEAQDNLADVFGTHGTDWNFGSISSDPSGFANSDFVGHGTDTELIAAGQALAKGSTATIAVEIELLTLNGLDPQTNAFCNDVEVEAGFSATGIKTSDLSTADDEMLPTGEPFPFPDPDPDGNNNPIERKESCITRDWLPVTLQEFSID